MAMNRIGPRLTARFPSNYQTAYFFFQRPNVYLIFTFSAGSWPPAGKIPAK
ncbi:MAG: hypothetical protein FD145_387 [Candidatus Saganbacteria bacterium]|uniref:Uncharacterized protein n=1 Tax=Candidatus Saganbacteria bacterium TaxID=2575572 RepID=A0A833L1Y3_UNCSA|nr:MAG: hypothetical protein FD145_387 [Candidatus Saganbacteria bacterium]